MKKILVVEDDTIIMNLIVILLERAGYEVVPAASAEEGIALAGSRSPDLILMDVALPGLDGLEATRMLKSMDATRRIPVIALTAQAMEEDVERAFRAGCEGFIVKPISTVGFLEQVSGFLSKGTVRETGDTVPGGHHILVVDDDETIRTFLRDLLEANKHDVSEAADVRSAAQMLKGREYELVLTDLMLPDGDGLEVLRAARARPYAPEVLVITAYGTIDSAVEAVRGGAFDYLTKPIATQKLLLTVDRAIERRALKNEVNNLRRAVGERYSPQGMVAASPSMRRIMELVDVVAASDSGILIQGESGTGKELIARAIHFRGARASRPFIAVNCAALPEALLESELFGYAKGAFTGAVAERKGLFEEAHGGTLLLDEIGDMPLLLQGKLLRVLQEGEIRRVGSTSVGRVDVRILASSNKDLRALIGEGKFRDDLFYRLNVIPLVIPPLRERTEDIVPLCRHFITMYAGKLGRGDQSLSAEAVEILQAYDWPGNIRELENVMVRAVTLTTSTVISAEELRVILSLGTAQAPAPGPGRAEAAGERTDGTIQNAEKELILQALHASDGNQTRAAHALGMGRNTLWRKMKKYGIQSNR